MPAAAAAAPWQLDPATSIAVDVPWEGATVTVRFPPPTGSVDFDPDHPETARATVTVSARGATTGVPIVDSLVRSADYLGVEAWPEMTFRLDRLTPTSKQTAKVEGRHHHARRHPADRLRRPGDPLRPGRRRPRTASTPASTSTGSLDRTAFGSTGGLPQVPAVLPIRIRLLMHSD